MFHFCQDELMMVLAAVPGVGYLCRCLKRWVTERKNRRMS